MIVLNADDLDAAWLTGDTITSPHDPVIVRSVSTSNAPAVTYKPFLEYSAGQAAAARRK